MTWSNAAFPDFGPSVAWLGLAGATPALYLVTDDSIAWIKRYDDATNTWSTSFALGEGYGGAIVVLGNGDFLCMGGHYEDGRRDLVYQTNPQTRIRTTKTPMPEPRSAAIAARYVDSGGIEQVILIGGLNALGSPTSSVYVYTPSTDTWATKNSLPIEVTRSDADVFWSPTTSSPVVIATNHSFLYKFVNGQPWQSHSLGVAPSVSRANGGGCVAGNRVIYSTMTQSIYSYNLDTSSNIDLAPPIFRYNMSVAVDSTHGRVIFAGGILNSISRTECLAFDLVTSNWAAPHPPSLQEAATYSKLAVKSDIDRMYFAGTNSVGSTTFQTLGGPPPSITSVLTKEGTQGTALSYSVTATYLPTSFGATGLPAGLSINTSTGVISGTPSVSGVINTTITATNAAGTDSATLVFTITFTPARPSITSALTKAGTQGIALSYSITATNDPTSFFAHDLPAGLGVHTGTGLISGTPLAPGVTNTTISARNTVGTGDGAVLVFTITGAAPNITSALTKAGTQGTALSYSITATNSPTSFGATSLPAGLSINTGTGVISGTPSAAGVTNTTITATNATGTDSATLVFTIADASTPPNITSALTKAGTQGTALSYSITATNSPTSYSASPLPAGLSVNTGTGVISGTPSAAGVTNTTITATNADGTDSATLVFTIDAGTAPNITSASTKAGTRSAALSYSITATNSPTSYSAGPLPAGLNINTGTGVISGTPLAPGVTNTTITATNATGTDSAVLVFTIASAPPVITSASTKAGTRGAALSYSITATNNPTSFGASSLPAGFSINTGTGVIWGLPSSAGTFNSTISATNVDGTDSATLVWEITQPAAPVITSSLSASGSDGTPFSYTITASNTPTSFDAISLPLGLSINRSSGLISGTPSVSGVFHVSIGASNLGGSATAALTITLAAAIPPVITSATTTTQQQGYSFSYAIVATHSPSSYSATGLPAGLTLNTSTGLITGIPSNTGTYNAVLHATNSAGSGTITLAITLTPGIPIPTITSGVTATVVIGVPYSYAITTDVTPVTYGASGLPSDLTFDLRVGRISGAVTNPGVSNVSLTATNDTGTGTATLVITARRPAPVITSSLMVTDNQFTTFAYDIAATNTPTSYNAIGLPLGLIINTTTGRISGTLIGEMGVFRPIISATNSGGTDTRTLTITIVPYVSPPPVVTSSLAVTIRVNTPLNYTIVATNNPTSFIATGLPAGLHLDNHSGLIYGTPTAAAVSNVTLTAINAGGTGEAILVLTVAEPTSKTVHGTGVLVSPRSTVWGSGLVVDPTGATRVAAKPDLPLDEAKITSFHVNVPGSTWAAQ